MSRKFAASKEPLPHPISDEHFEELSRHQGFTTEQRFEARRFVDDIVKIYGPWVADARKRLGVTDQVKLTKRITERLESVINDLGRLDENTAWHLSKALALYLTPLVSPALPPQVLGQMTGSSGFSPPGERSVGRETRNFNIMCAHGSDVAVVLIKAVAGGIRWFLEEDRNSSRPRGGAKRLMWRELTINSLYNFYEDIGRRPTATPTGKFVLFGESVFDGIGWPTEGVQAMISRVISNLQNQRKKS